MKLTKEKYLNYLAIINERMENIFEPFILEKGLVILDGALATELEVRGADLNHALWSAKLLNDDPQLIKQVHYDYMEAGADIITSASYQASFEGFAKQGYSKEAAKRLLNLSISLAADARIEFLKKNPGKKHPLIAASAGPYGASLADGSEYRGNYGVPIEKLKDFHRERLELFATSGADFIAFETIPCIDEAIAIMDLINEAGNSRAWVSFSCKDDEHLCSGEPLANAIELLNTCKKIMAVGVNCTAPEYIETLIKRAVSVTDKLIVVYPNKGEVWNPEQKCWISTADGHRHFADDAKVWHEAGATIIGGCCRTGPDDIRSLKKMFQ